MVRNMTTEYIVLFSFAISLALTTFLWGLGALYVDNAS